MAGATPDYSVRVHEVMDGFCGSPFWDVNVTWYTEHPNFTECFHKTIMLWAPCGFLWVFGLLQILVEGRKRSDRDSVPWSILIMIKSVVMLALVGITIAGLVVLAQDEDCSKADITAASVLLATFILAICIIHLDRWKGRPASLLMFFFWLFLCGTGGFAIAAVVAGYKDHKETQYETTPYQLKYFKGALIAMYGEENPSFREIRAFRSGVSDWIEKTNFALYIVYYSLTVVMLILQFIPEKMTELERVKRRNVCPAYKYPAPGQLLFSWMDPLMWKGFRTPITKNDLWELSSSNRSGNLTRKFEKYLGSALMVETEDGSGTEGQKRLGQPTKLSVPLLKVFGKDILVGLTTRIIYDVMVFINPLMLKLILAFIEDPRQEDWKGKLYAVIMLGVATIMTLIQAKYFNIMMLTGMRIRSALCTTLFKKALFMNTSARRDTSIGEIVNLMAVDAQRFIDATTFLGMLFSAPIQVALCLYFLSDLLGVATLSGLGVMILSIPAQAIISMQQRKRQMATMLIKDERAKMMSEILNGMKVLKLYGWEPSFEKIITEIRAKELTLIKQIAVLQACSAMLMTFAPFAVALASFATFIGVEGAAAFTPEVAFVSMSYLNLLRFPLNIVPMLLTYLIQAKVSIGRMNEYFDLPNVSDKTVTHHKSEYAVEVNDGDFAWSANSPVFLSNLNVHIKPGSLVGVVGSVGAGKSSFVNAMLGEMEKVKGTVNIAGSLAYVPQQAWIQNCTVRDNILFGSRFEQKWYNKVIDSCALVTDLEILSAGDKTEIGEKGINVSGGQKQRISLARAVYSKSDVYFLDDPLSAVDSHVGAHLFEHVIGPKGVLKGKTRVLVTHGLTYLQDMDLIFVLKDGVVMETGSYDDLMKKQGEMHRLVQEFVQEAKAEEESMDRSRVLSMTSGLSRAVSVVSRKSTRSKHGTVRGSMRSKSGSLRGTARRRRMSIDSGMDANPGDPNAMYQMEEVEEEDERKDADKNDKAKLITEESMDSGSVSLATLKYYLNSMGYLMFFITMAGFALSYGAKIGGDLWLAHYTDNPNPTNKEMKRFLYFYSVFGVGQVFLMGIGDICRAVSMMVAARLIHQSLLRNVMRCPMSFFDTTPIGRLVNRFSKDIDVLDTNLPQSSRTVMWSTWNVLGIFAMIAQATPIFLAPLVPIIILFVVIQRFYVKTSNQFRRLEAVTRSPIYSLYGETLAGVSSIRAYRQTNRFINNCLQKVDLNQAAYFPYVSATRWLACRLETLANLVVFFSALFAVLSRGSNSASDAGVSVSYALSVIQVLNWMVRMSSEAETYLVSVERLLEYSELPEEPAWEIKETKPDSSWPKRGAVRFQNYSTRYREDRDLVIRGITASINPGEMVGIVGRTGAGKSSLTLALFRIIEAAEGAIFIDDVDISKIGLHDLRTKITIIPQDPVLFSGSVRMNLDPFDMYSDEQVWRSLELAHLKSFTDELEDGLNHVISEGGENLSVGQRQLMCLARALLKKTNILILDEATAAVDLETDQLIQATIREQFSDCTIITIAHRLNTILDYDKVMVLDQGCLKEFESPSNLMENRDSIFHSMAKAAGLVS